MNQHASHSRYMKQFLGDNTAGRQNASQPGTYREDFLKVSRPQMAQESETVRAVPEKEPAKETPPSAMAKKELLWRNNKGRFPEEDLPYLSARSVKQLESNYRELMMIEANVSALVKGGNKFYVTSCADKEGKTISAISMAYALSFYAGKEVVLMDMNPHAPQLHRLFGIPEKAPGALELCSGKAQLENLVLPTRHEGLSVIPLGAGGRFESSAAVEPLFETLSKTFDYVFCDGSSIMSSSAALRYIRVFDALMIVIECEKTRWEVVQVAEDKIKKSGGPTAVGVIYNRRKYYIPRLVYKILSK